MICPRSETTAAESATAIGGIVTGTLFVVDDHHQVFEDPRLAEIFENATSKLASRLTGLDADQETAVPSVQVLPLPIRPSSHSRIADRAFAAVAAAEAAETGTAAEDARFTRTGLIASGAGRKKHAGARLETGTIAIPTDTWTPKYGRATA